MLCLICFCLLLFCRVGVRVFLFFSSSIGVVVFDAAGSDGVVSVLVVSDGGVD